MSRTQQRQCRDFTRSAHVEIESRGLGTSVGGHKRKIQRLQGASRKAFEIWVISRPVNTASLQELLYWHSLEQSPKRPFSGSLQDAAQWEGQWVSSSPGSNPNQV